VEARKWAASAARWTPGLIHGRPAPSESNALGQCGPSRTHAVSRRAARRRSGAGLFCTARIRRAAVGQGGVRRRVAIVTPRHPLEAVLRRELNTLRYLDGAGMYEVDEVPMSIVECR
jgi:hypothetical protein